MKYTITLERGNGDGPSEPRGQDREKLILQARPGESARHIALKLLGYLLYRDFSPVIETGVGWHYKPDLVSWEGAASDKSVGAGAGGGQVRLWVECGVVGARKIERVSAWLPPTATLAILRATRSDAFHLRDAIRHRLKPGRAARLHWFEPGAVDALAGRLDATNHLRWQAGEGRLDLRLENRGGTLDWRGGPGMEVVG